MAKPDLMFDPRYFVWGIKPERSQRFMESVRIEIKKVKALKHGGWKKDGYYYHNEHFPNYKIAIERDGGEWEIRTERNTKDSLPTPDILWDMSQINDDFMWLGRPKSQLPYYSVQLVIARARKHRPYDHPDWIAQATGEEPDIVWAAYEKIAAEKIAAYWALSHQKRRHVSWPWLYKRGDYYIEEGAENV